MPNRYFILFELVIEKELGDFQNLRVLPYADKSSL